MSNALADTHAIVWYLFDPHRLSETAASALFAAELSGRIFISTISLAEVNYLAGKKSFPYSGALSRLYTLLDDPNEPLAALPLTVDVVKAMERVPRIEIPDMPDRIVAATALAYRLPLISVDADIQGSGALKGVIPVIW